MCLKGLGRVGRGVALLEVLVALLVFSIAGLGGLRAQLGALAATRDTLAQARAGRLVLDIAQRHGAAELAGIAPASLPLAAIDRTVPAAFHALEAAGGGPAWRAPASRLCLARTGSTLALSIAWRASELSGGVSCADGGQRVTAWVVP
ncbi:MAG: hypothetical protein ACX93N_06965 [Pseudohaliea sp.]